MLSKRQQFLFVLAIPVINVIADSTQGYFEAGLLSPGYLRGLILMFFIVLFFKDFFKIETINILILISVVYFFILSFFSSDVLYTQSIFIKYLEASIMFPIGYYYFRNMDQFKKLLQVLRLVLFIYILILIISNVFELGSSDYLMGSVYFGAGRVNMTKAMSVLVLMSPVFFRFEESIRKRRIILIIVISALIFILLGVKRSALLSLSVGFFIYFIFAPQKARAIKIVFIIGMVLIISSPLYYNVLSQRFMVRQEAGRFDSSKFEEEEGRVIELRRVMDAFINGNLSYKLFGAELFNGRALFKTRRVLHTDLAIVFSGSGLVGLSLLLLFYYLIFMKSYKYLRRFRSDPDISSIMAVSISVLFAVILAGIGGTITGIGLRSIAYVYWGASFSMIRYHFMPMTSPVAKKELYV